MKVRNVLLLLLMVAVMTSCCCSKKQGSNENISSVPGPQTIIYKTTGDFFNNVPIGLNPDGSIASYPAPSDLKIGGKLAYPTRLEDGFLLDNKGISTNVAFLKWTYEEYAALPKSPSVDEIKAMILEEKPLKEMYTCGLKSKFENPVDEINKVIKGGKKELKNTFKKVY